MSFFGKLFGRKAGAPPPPASAPPPGAPAMMKVWDAYGRVGEIPREEWRTRILPANFRKQWNDPGPLAALIDNALQDGFVADCLEPARQLHRIDPQPKRGATYLAVVLLQLGKFDEALRILLDSIGRHGEDGVLMTNLAKAYAGQGDAALAERTLWRALELDPNLDNGFGWYVAIHRERGGESAAAEALRRVAALPGSWRARLWLARDALKGRELDQALVLYREALALGGTPAPADLLMQVSGDLGNAGHLPEILQLVEPHFDASVHGLPVGNNLIKAHLDLGQFEAARRILDALYKLNRADWKGHLSFWDTELAKARLAVSPKDPGEDLKITMLAMDGPVWLRPDSAFAELFPAQTGDPIRIGFLGSTADVATNSKRTQKQLADAPGRMSRALPLFLAEQVAFGGRARVQTLVPWIVGESPGFVLSGGAWKDDDAANFARQSDFKPDYVITSHLRPVHEPWSAELRLVRAIDATCLATLSASFPSAQPQDGIPGLARRLLALLHQHSELELVEPPANYQAPAGPPFAGYLLRLEQLLAVRCAGMDGVRSEFLHGAREIIDGNLQLCLALPENVAVRVLLAQTLAGFKRVRPMILPEFKDRIELLQKEKPLAHPAQDIVQRVLNETLAA